MEEDGMLQGDRAGTWLGSASICVVYNMEVWELAVWTAEEHICSCFPVEGKGHSHTGLEGVLRTILSFFLLPLL